MQITGRVAFLVICVFTAHSMPNLAVSHDDNVYELLVAQMRSALIDTRALSPAESYCGNTYNNRTQEVNNNLTNETSTCFATANRTIEINAKNANVTTTAIRADLTTVQLQLANCTRINDTAQFLNCVSASYDNNMDLLDRANSQALLLTVELEVDNFEIDIACHACLGVAISHAKHNLTNAANDYNDCLVSIPRQRLVENFQDKPVETPVNVLPVAISVEDEPVVVPAYRPLDESTVELNNNDI